MKKSLKEWMLAQDADADSRLDALRARALAPGMSPGQFLQALFQPAAAWATLGVVWLVLVAAYLVTQRPQADSFRAGLWTESAALVTTTDNEAPTPLAHHS